MYGLVAIQNANIKGKVITGPTAPYPTWGANGGAGDLNWNSSGIEPGWYRNDFNAAFPDVSVPYTTGFAPTQVGNNPATNFLGAGNYIINGDFTMNAGDVLQVNGKANLYITGNFTMKSSGSSASTINIAKLGSLKIFVGGPSAVLQQVNTAAQAGSYVNASKFFYFGLPTNTSITWSGNSSYVGAVYAPEATFNLGGGGSNTQDYQGACVVNAVAMNGHFNFHYDENLKRAGPFSGYRVASWKEL
jgi:hypothetical protein